jgi:Tol biopolymer transport system component
VYRQGSTFGGGANFFSFSPDASQILTSNGVSIVWRNATTGDALQDPLVAQGAMPDWAPDGALMVYARPGTTAPCFGGFCGAPGVSSASLNLHRFAGGVWSEGPTLVPFEGQNNYYPTFAPDGGWVLFNRSPSNADSFDAPDAQVWVVPTTGGPPTHLGRASTGGDSWPKWDPTVYEHRGRNLMWLTFSSRRAYGLRLGDGERSQLWMAAFEPSRLAAGETDPSYPAFWMPFQEIESGNHIAQWVTRVDRQPCSSDSPCGPGEFCTDGFCYPDLI